MSPVRRLVVALLIVGLGGMAAACSSSAGDSDASDGAVEETEVAGAAGGGADVETLHPDVIDADGVRAADGTWTISATLSSPYDTPARYADAWRVLGPDGEVFGIRELTHDHQAEQPFTRSQSGISIPDDVDVVIIEGRDQVSGWGGDRFELQLDRTGGQ